MAEKIDKGGAIGCLFFIILGGILFVSCSPDEKETPAVSYKHQMDSNAIGLVRATQNAPKGEHFITAPLNGGVAVIADEYAGYWVKDKKVYATNGVASNWSVNIEYSPPEIDQMKIIKAIETHQEIVLKK